MPWGFCTHAGRLLVNGDGDGDGKLLYQVVEYNKFINWTSPKRDLVDHTPPGKSFTGPH
jgi:hypothetical protein